ncbi:taurine ABC transporter substrate-binding protein, partial [Mesorhizobium sp. M00.F.Ca.ET.149.01.1.1]
MRKLISAALVALAAAATSGTAHADDKKVVIAYQTG